MLLEFLFTRKWILSLSKKSYLCLFDNNTRSYKAVKGRIIIRCRRCCYYSWQKIPQWFSRDPKRYDFFYLFRIYSSKFIDLLLKLKITSAALCHLCYRLSEVRWPGLCCCRLAFAINWSKPWCIVQCIDWRNLPGSFTDYYLLKLVN